MIDRVDHADGVILAVRAHAGARCNAVRGLQDGALKVSVTQVAEKGRANKAIMQVLRDSLSLGRGQLELIAGQTSSKKRFLVRQIDAAKLSQRIRKLLAT